MLQSYSSILFLRINLMQKKRGIEKSTPLLNAILN
jgi:hypothetical protein